MIGKIIEHYRIVEELGRGGMGVVYKAQDTKLKRTVALKFLPPEMTRDPDAKARFIHEAQAASALQHHNICTIHDVDETADGQLFIVMDYYQGETLKDRINIGESNVRATHRVALTFPECIDITIQIAAGLQEAHSNGIVHRDIKPANIMITEKGEVKIMDFGLAKLAGRSMLTKSGTTLGTVAYMSPEQARAEEVDHRSDIWSLGIILYQLITGYPPFRGDYDQAVIYGILNEEPEALTAIRSGVPLELERITTKMLAKNPAERYQHLDELLVDLKRLKKESEFSVKTKTSMSIASKSKKVFDKKLILAGIILTVLVAGFLVLKPLLEDQALASRPIRIAVITFENQTGDSTYNYLQKVIPNLLITDLEQSKYLQVATWERLRDLLKQMKKKETELIDEETGFELCRRDGIPALALGSVTKAGNVFVTDVKVIDVDTKQLLKSVRSQGEGVESILRKQIDELGKEIAKGVGLPESKVEEAPLRIAEVTTTSTAAYNYFLRGREESEKQDDIEAVNFLEKAVKLDSTFAMAYLYLARAYNAAYANTRAENEYYRKAKLYSAKASEKEKLYIEASYARAIELDFNKQLKILQEMQQRYPKEKYVYYALSTCYQQQASYGKAIEACNKSLSLDPNFGAGLNQLAYIYADLGEYQKAINYLEKYAAVNPGDANPFDSMGDMYFYLGDLSAAVAKYQEAVDIKEYFMSSFKLAYISALLENYPTGLEWLEYYQKHLPVSTPVGGVYGWKCYMHYLMGEKKQALLDLQQAQKIWGTLENRFFISTADYIKAWIFLNEREYNSGIKLADQATTIFIEMNPSGKENYLANLELYHGIVALEKGQLETARQQVTVVRMQLPEVAQSVEPDVRYRFTLFWSWVLLAEGKVDSAITVCKRAIANRPHDLGAANLAGYTIYSLYAPLRNVMARAYLQKGQLSEAIAEYERLSSFDPKQEDRRFISPEYHYSLARLYEQAGSNKKAINEYQKFLQIWKKADPDLPELIDAKKRLAKLTAMVTK
jgi:serine/threonine protein kinase/Tfp pilus assembly protein PilF